MIAQDSDKLLVLDGIKRRGLFSWLLPRVIIVILMIGITISGIVFTLYLVGKGIID